VRRNPKSKLLLPFTFNLYPFTCPVLLNLALLNLPVLLKLLKPMLLLASLTKWGSETTSYLSQEKASCSLPGEPGSREI
jgi:hypothetical protein